MKDKYIDLIEQTFDFPQDEFSVEDNELNFHDIPLMELIKQYGTPLKITYLPKISQQINRAKRMFNVAMAKVDYKGSYNYCYCTKSSHFSFVLEEKFATIFSLLERFRIKTNLIHNSAVNLSLCVDNSWHIDEAIEALREAGFDVMKAENMELLTVRGYTDELWRKYARGPQVFVRQATQSTVRVVRKRS